MNFVEDFKFTYVSHTYGKGGQHTNGPDYGILRCEHVATGCAVELDTWLAHGQYKAREITLTLCSLMVSELARTAGADTGEVL